MSSLVPFRTGFANRSVALYWPILSGNFEDILAVLIWPQSLLDARVVGEEDGSDCMAVDEEGGSLALLL